MKVGDILAIKKGALFTIAPNTKLTEAITIMTQHDLGALIVMDSAHLKGVLTFREILKGVAAKGSQWAELIVEEVMLKQPQVVSPELSMENLRAALLLNHQRYIPVMDDNVLLGMVSFHDVAKAVLEEQNFENQMLKKYIKNWPSEENS